METADTAATTIRSNAPALCRSWPPWVRRWPTARRCARTYFTELKQQVVAKHKAFREGKITEAEFSEFIGQAEEQVRRQEGSRFRNLADSGRGGVVSTKALQTGREAAPLAIDDESLHALHGAGLSRQSLRVKAFNTAEGQLPAQLMPQVLGPIHENRLLDRLPVQPTTAASIEYIRHTSTTGAAAVVAEGAVKPELVFNIDQLEARPQKIAAHTAVSYEILSDWAPFVGYVQGELFREIIDTENGELLNGAGTTGHLSGLLHTSGILTHAVDTANDEMPLDAIELSIATMRVGAALAEPDLLVLNPLTWSAIRRSKDSQGRYLTAPDPTADEANSCWGVEVLVTTEIAAGAGAMLDTRKFGKVVLRENLSLQTGTNNDDFTRNITRFVGEERRRARRRAARRGAVAHRIADSMRVKVRAHVQVCHDGAIYRPGETAEVPDAVAQRWLVSGWVEQVHAGRKAPAKGADKPAGDAEE
jgi:HK97 family phage major capsid protein